MGLIEDAKALAAMTATYGHVISPYVCENLTEFHEDCCYCDATLIGPKREPLGDHKPDCPWLALPRIVAALEAAQQLLKPALSEPSEYVEDDGRWYWEFCEQPQSEKHAPDCPWQALVEAMRDAP